MSGKPVAWMTPGGDVSRSLEWCKERCWPEGEQPTPLYAQSPAQARALAIAEAARVIDAYGDSLLEVSTKHASIADECADIVRALSSPPSVTEEWVRKQIRTIPAQINMADALLAVRATLAALGITVEGAAK